MLAEVAKIVFEIVIWVQYEKIGGVLLFLRLIKVVLVQDERVGEDVAQQAGERRLAARGAAGDAYNEGLWAVTHLGCD